MRRLWIPVVAAMTVICAVGVYVFCPQFRLWVHSNKLRKVDATHWVNARAYDSEWFDAARAGRVDVLQVLHDAHYPIDAQNQSGYTAVILAAYDDQPGTLEYLLGAGADPCIADHNGNSALMGAIYKGHMAIAQRLIQTDCHVDQANKAGETALAFAVLFGRQVLISDLLHHGARLDSRDTSGQTPMSIAAKQGNIAMVRALRSLGASN